MSAQGDDLTLAEAVPLATVLLQRLLADAGVRSLAIKGPAFVQLGVRAPKQSNDVDLLIHPDDRVVVKEALLAAGWNQLSQRFPNEIDDVIYSTTYHHPILPATVDVHHRFPGVMVSPTDAFDRLWSAREPVRIAHCDVISLSDSHALVIEALNQFKSVRAMDEARVAQVLLAQLSPGVDIDSAEHGAKELGAQFTIAPLLSAMGRPPSGREPTSLRRWNSRNSASRRREILSALAIRAPRHLPRAVIDDLLLPDETARIWARNRGIRYRGRWQVLGHRLLAKLPTPRSRRR